MRNKKKTIVFVSIFFLLVGVSALLVSLSVRERPFNTSEWKQVHDYFQRSYPFPTQSGNIQRVEMLTDLLKSHLRLGMKRQEAKALLGGADSEDGTGDHGPIDVYNLVENPAQPQLWQVKLWFRYRTTDPALKLEYESKDDQLIGIFVGE